jgi:two-component system, sensor histidine kinase
MAPPPASREVPLVLVADDIEIHRSLAVTLLDGLGLAAHTVTNGQEAIDAACGLQPNLILMDCRMPHMDGLAATRVLRRLQNTGPLSHAPILGLSAGMDPALVIRARDAGMDACLSKPLRRLPLQRALDRYGLFHPNPPCVA